MSQQEKTVSTRRIHEGRIINLREDIVLLPSGREAKREIVEHHGAVCIVPILDDGRIVLVRQWRHPAEDALLEVPAGGLEPNEEPIEAARRELAEECGYRTAQISPLYTAFLAPGYSTELMYAYKAEALTEGETDPDEDEDVQVEIYALDELMQMISDGRIRDSKTISALACLYFQRSQS